MFDIGFLELLVIALITLVVMGPERLPEAIRTLSLWFGRIKQFLAKARLDIENEVGMDEIRHQLHNEQVLRELDDSKSQIEQAISNPSRPPKTEQPND